MKNILTLVMLSLISVMSIMSVNIDGFAHNNEISGDIVTAKCECGFEETIKFGAGKSNYKTVCNFPFSCNFCNSFVVLNYLSEKPVCKLCNSEDVTSYDNDKMRAHKSDNSVAGWNANDRKFILTDDFYFCPKCKEFKLTFTSVGNFD